MFEGKQTGPKVESETRLFGFYATMRDLRVRPGKNKLLASACKEAELSEGINQHGYILRG